MSGGSMNYIFERVQEAAYLTEDKELSELLNDISKVLHDEEWAQCSDISEESYKRTLTAFKKKWFIDDRSERLKGYINDEIKKLRSNLYLLIGTEGDG